MVIITYNIYIFLTMKTKLNIIKKDLYNVFVMGNADERQLARIYFLLAIPFFTLLFTFGHFPTYK